jgi:hypothetical protein
MRYECNVAGDIKRSLRVVTRRHDFSMKKSIKTAYFEILPRSHTFLTVVLNISWSSIILRQKKHERKWKYFSMHQYLQTNVDNCDYYYHMKFICKETCCQLKYVNKFSSKITIGLADANCKSKNEKLKKIFLNNENTYFFNSSYMVSIWVILLLVRLTSWSNMFLTLWTAILKGSRSYRCTNSNISPPTYC